MTGSTRSPSQRCARVLLHHVAPGERFSGDVLDSTRIRTLNRDFVYPSVQGGSAYISGATILIADVDASNGVIHVIDSVLLPGQLILRHARRPAGSPRAGRFRVSDARHSRPSTTRGGGVAIDTASAGSDHDAMTERARQR